MDLVRSYIRLQSIGKLCTVAAWVVLTIGILLFCYISFFLFPGVNTYTVGGSYTLQLLVILGLLAIPTGGLTVLLFASGALIEYITIQDGSSQEDDEDGAVVRAGNNVRAVEANNVATIASASDIDNAEDAGTSSPVEVVSISKDERDALG